MTEAEYDRPTDYARRVVAGLVPGVGKRHIQACQRHLRDLERQNTDEFPYYWDPEAADRIIRFAETLTIAEGQKPKPVHLLDCQAFDFGATFGWKKSGTGFRRFRRSYKSMARQQGKTFSNGITGTYIAGFSGYREGKCFTVATQKRQAKIAWDEMRKFIQSDQDLQELFSVKEYRLEIKSLTTNTTIEALSKEGGLQDGFRSIFASIDEIHQHKDNGIYKAIYNGTRQLDETLVSMITTRGSNLNSFCKEMDDYCLKILDGTVSAEDFFVDIYCLDDGDDYFEEANWQKANPLTFSPGHENALQTLRQDAQTAKDMGGADLRDFITKSLNMWVQNTDDVFINPDYWKKCASDKTLADFKGSQIYIGLDLSSGGDLTSYAVEIPYKDADGVQKYHFFQHSYMPRGRMSEHVETDLAPYDVWEKQGLITVTGTRNDFKNDYQFIIKEIGEMIDRYGFKLAAIGIDPHNADGILSELESFGAPVVTVTQSARSLNDATCDFQLLCKSGAITYDKRDELLSWSVLNAEVVRNSFDEIKVDKRERRRQRRIDCVDACIDAHDLVVKAKASEPIDGNESMSRYFNLMGW